MNWLSRLGDALFLAVVAIGAGLAGFLTAPFDLRVSTAYYIMSGTLGVVVLGIVMNRVVKKWAVYQVQQAIREAVREELQETLVPRLEALRSVATKATKAAETLKKGKK